MHAFAFISIFTLAVSSVSASTQVHDHHKQIARSHGSDVRYIARAFGSPDSREVVAGRPARRPRRRANSGKAKRCTAQTASTFATSSASTTSPTSPTSTTPTTSATPTSSVVQNDIVEVKTTTQPPKTTSSTKVAEETPTKTSTKAAENTEESTSNGSKGGNTGEGTFYDTGLGACGITNNDGQYIAAVSKLLFDTYPGYDGANPNNNPICRKKVKATWEGKSVIVEITDRCEGCAYGDLDFSPSAYDQLAARSLGRIEGMTWVWL